MFSIFRSDTPLVLRSSFFPFYHVFRDVGRFLRILVYCPCRATGVLFSGYEARLET
jgi:hypothetical protein